MKFSILIAHFNNAIYFKECFDSLVAQTYPNWEAIILDDGSRQEESSIIKDIIKEDSRFKYFTNSRNEGVGFTKSKLIELATGDILGYVDPDDALFSSAIEKSIDVFEKNKKAVLTYSRLIFCDKDLKPLAPFQSPMQVENHNPYFFNCPIQINHFVCFRKDIYETTEKINPDLKISEDQDLYLKMYEKGDVAFINDTNYLYRTHAGGISQNENKEKSYDYWGKVIWSAMQRRGLTTINGKKIPTTFTSSQEIFKLLKYQNSISYRIRKRLKIILQSFS
ncbi:glycosyltransferase family 2 protein [Chryseobacterium sp. MP_3.2]|uniref:glycosyltransferase family 2 protein n=1 Tax=Chryseobacterium sp. MP_3.2 TaxID=3071712 RepID=UPI002E02EF26|nr:glycosyltransferase involved in cell wall biosynthesis [Chryseobacterium sp. MP_3.2]